MANWQVNGEHLLFAEIQARAAELASHEAPGQLLLPEHHAHFREQATELLIDRLLLVQEARRLHLDPSPSEVEQVQMSLSSPSAAVAACRADLRTQFTTEELARRLMVDRMLDRWRSSVSRPRPEEVRKHYSVNKDQFYKPELLHAAHVFRASERYANSEEGKVDLDRLRALVLAGERFADIASKHSDCPENGGELGWFPRGVMVEEFDRVAFSAPTGHLTPVFETPFGFHFAFIHNRKPSGIRPLDEVRASIEQTLWLGKQDREVGRRINELRSRAEIRRLP